MPASVLYETVVDHGPLADSRQAEKMKAMWRICLTEPKTILER